MAKHTPAPWTVWKDHAIVYSGVGHNSSTSLVEKDGQKLKRICECEDEHLMEATATDIANARLIAAAPDLLAELKACSQTLHDLAKALAREGWGPTSAITKNAARDADQAIAKAEGSE